METRVSSRDRQIDVDKARQSEMVIGTDAVLCVRI
jgi:hypothetical protein